jgi:beta-glucosidase-like glycosyl hydrolase
MVRGAADVSLLEAVLSGALVVLVGLGSVFLFLSANTLVYEEAEAAGEFSSWPGTLGLAATNDIKLIRAFAEIARAEWRASGIQKCYGYQVDVATEPRWYRIQTTFGESPKWNAEIAREIVLGFQGPALGPQSVAQSIKHFPGDGAVDRGLDPHNNWGQWAVYPTPGSFFKYQLPPFQAAVDAGASSIMSYYNNPSNDRSGEQLPKEWWQSGKQQFEEVAGAYNMTLLTRLLRGRMGFKGYVNTDTGILTNNAFGVEKLSTPQRFAKAVKAGVALFSDSNNPQGLLDAIQQHLLEESDLTPGVALLLKEIFQLGHFETPYTDPEAAQKIASSPASAAGRRSPPQVHRPFAQRSETAADDGRPEALRGGHGRSAHRLRWSWWRGGPRPGRWEGGAPLGRVGQGPNRGRFHRSPVEGAAGASSPGEEGLLRSTAPPPLRLCSRRIRRCRSWTRSTRLTWPCYGCAPLFTSGPSTIMPTLR